jgi:hypothetical protein
MRRVWLFRVATLLLVLAPLAASLAAVPRAGIPTGKVVSASGDETIQFISESNWRNVEIEQDLLTGDKLRTGPNGALALRFVDQTLIRVHRNSELVVKNMGGGTRPSDLSLGQIWARALEGGDGVEVTTPSATAAIKGTDWSMSVGPDGKTTLVVVAGVVNLYNEFGAIDVAAGEAAIAEIGRAPNKIILARPPGREQMLYYLQARGMFAWLPVSDLTAPEQRRRRQALMSQEPASLTPADRWNWPNWLAFRRRRGVGRSIAAAGRPIGPAAGTRLAHDAAAGDRCRPQERLDKCRRRLRGGRCRAFRPTTVVGQNRALSGADPGGSGGGGQGLRTGDRRTARGFLSAAGPGVFRGDGRRHG